MAGRATKSGRRIIAVEQNSCIPGRLCRIAAFLRGATGWQVPL